MITDKTENIFERLTIIFNVPVHFLLDSLLESISSLLGCVYLVQDTVGIELPWWLSSKESAC